MFQRYQAHEDMTIGEYSKRMQGELQWDEIQKHTSVSDKWIVIEGKVYDVTNWCKKHPGGSRVISHYAGQDATDAFTAFHNDLGKVTKYLTPLHIGHVTAGQKTKDIALEADFRKLRITAKNMVRIIMTGTRVHIYTHIYISGFRSGATVILGFQPRLRVATNLKPSTKIDVYTWNTHGCYILIT